MSDSADKTTEKPAGAVDHWDEKTKKQFNGKSRSEWFDPCQEAANKSFKCLNRNGGDRALCQDYFQAYRDCKKQWTEKRRKDGGGLFG